MTTASPILALLAAFLIGSIPFAVIVSKLMGLDDPRSYGSGNPGATNVLRSGNKAAAVLTLLGDAAKGLIALLLAKALAPDLGLSMQVLAGVAIAVFLGHVFSIFLRFKGGKGVATAAGVLLGIDWRLGAAVLGVWLVVAIVSRYSSLAALSAAVAAPALTLWLTHSDTWTGAVVIMSAILIWRHKDNIRKLLAGQEGRIGKKKKPEDQAKA
ncbi:glycerol-3-phosphate 1-O-acyltransferase PlsY [Uliginosibacterium sp. H3]|uniref:Glycerol-3-phosphate acyltransferase n=1 Tax=Uliginosibacterium silvisoli TaxID=3114758 RepID=A0ABU6K3B0_9RHOO|nr:glycerol-3-phosphate 1-O-acyltransferase PlsY [Uliginosibacterium sp. H3]